MPFALRVLRIALLAVARRVHAQPIATALQSAHLDVRVAGDASIRVTLRPLGFGASFPVSPVVVAIGDPTSAASIRATRLTGELYVRWHQFVSFNGSFRSHGRTWFTRLPWGWGLSDMGPRESTRPFHLMTVATFSSRR